MASSFRRPGTTDSISFRYEFDLDKDAVGDAAFTHTRAAARDELPVQQYRDQFLALVEEHVVTLVVGAAGCGKTTQLPQFLLDHGWADEGYQIVCTQPRLLAAANVAQRVAEERGTALGAEVGLSGPFNRLMATGVTKLKFTTDEALLRELLDDPLLSSYSVVVVDEVHERTTASDLLLGLLRKVLRKRKELRVVIASAALDVEKFSKFFREAAASPAPALLNIEGRLYPVQTHYLKVADVRSDIQSPSADYVVAAADTVLHIHRAELPGDILVFLTGQAEVRRCIDVIEEQAARSVVLRQLRSRLVAMPLHAGMSAAQQADLFKPAPRNTRRAVISTNIAETGVTLEGVVYVVDSLLAKQATYNPVTNLSSLLVAPISKASALQRSGRAGRLRPGHCFRLCTHDSFEGLRDANVPQIQRSHLGESVLYLKAVGIDNIMTFAWLDAPPSEAAVRALEQLYALGAINENAKLTQDRGAKMAELALRPELSAALLAAEGLGCVEEVATVAALMNVSSVWTSGRGKAAQAARAKFAVAEGDMIAFLNVWRAWIEHGRSSAWAYRNYVAHRAMLRASDIRAELLSRLKGLHVQISSCGDDVAPVCKALLTGFCLSACTYTSTLYDDLRPGGYSTHVYRPLLSGGAAPETLRLDEGSVLARSKPELVVYASCALGDDEQWRMYDVLAPSAAMLHDVAPHVFQWADHRPTPSAR